VPPFDEDDELGPEPPAVASLRRAVAEADVLLFATPEYNASIPGQLKNAIDWLSRPFATTVLRNKPALVVGASTGAFGAVWSQAELRKVLAAAGARVVEADVAVGHAPSRFDEAGSLVDQELREQLAEALDVLLAEAPARPVALAV
jgi:chromate reductase